MQDKATEDLLARHVVDQRDFRDESFAPQVDHALLEALVAGQLPTDDAQAAYRLITSFKSWNQQHIQILANHARAASEQKPTR